VPVIAGPSLSEEFLMDEIVLGRIGHYHDPGSGACSAALVTDVTGRSAPVPIVSLRVWQSDAEDVRRLDVPVESPTEHGAEGSHATFHLSRACQWGR
jgi:hypothetical protein